MFVFENQQRIMVSDRLTSKTKEYLSKNFTSDFIKASLQTAYDILKQYYKVFSIEEVGEEQSKPTSEFVQVNNEQGNLTPQVRTLIISYLSTFKFTENDILSLTIAYVNSMSYDKAAVCLIDNNDEGNIQELYEVLIEKRVSAELPTYLKVVLVESMAMFCAEFDISRGLLDNEYFIDLLPVYCTFNNCN